MNKTTIQTAMRGRFSSLYILGCIVCVAGVMLWRWLQAYPIPLFDLYPLYYGGIAWLRTGDAYRLGEVVPELHRQYLVHQIGNGYPLPAVLLTLPLTMFPPHYAAVLWVGILALGLLIALRLNATPLWILLYVPLLEGLRIEQYTVMIVILQMLAVWSYREQRMWLLAFCCALILTKPSHGAFFVIAMLLIAGHWRQQLVVTGSVWLGTFLLDPNWVTEWIAGVQGYAATANQPVLWPMLLLVLPLLLTKDILNIALVAQLALAPFPGVYAAGGLCVGLLDDHRSKWLVVVSYFWPIIAVYGGKSWATALTLVLPVVLLSLLRWRASAGRRQQLVVA